MRPRPILIRDQVATMKATWPALKLRRQSFEGAKWVGQLRPQFQKYKISIDYQILKHPVVKVLSPELIRLPGNEEGQLPHVYPPDENPSLCLYDPKTDEWNDDKFLSRTIVPWALDWLSCYELWLMTGRWTGGGRHPVTEDQEAEATS